jgi:hypothetical protein
MVCLVADSDNSKKLTVTEGETGERAVLAVSEDKLARDSPSRSALINRKLAPPGDRQRGTLRS